MSIACSMPECLVQKLAVKQPSRLSLHVQLHGIGECIYPSTARITHTIAATSIICENYAVSVWIDSSMYHHCRFTGKLCICAVLAASQSALEGVNQSLHCIHALYTCTPDLSLKQWVHVLYLPCAAGIFVLSLFMISWRFIVVLAEQLRHLFQRSPEGIWVLSQLAQW
jgi:hypothetical protein